MKIEKINENQIRCTLTSADLSSREIRLSELAYGSAKAKRLFQDMMKQAEHEFGFAADDAPLMIEAIPVSSDSIILTITKVNDPEELDSRFSRFTQSDEKPEHHRLSIGADDILDLFQKIHDTKKEASAEHAAPAKAKEAKKQPTSKHASAAEIMQMYTFAALDDVIRASRSVGTLFRDTNTLYKVTEDAQPYKLILHQNSSTPEEFNKLCNILSEYGTRSSCTAAMEAHLTELGHAVLTDQAIQQLATL